MYPTKPTRTQALEEQTEIRRRLLEGGYCPLPNVNKQCFLKGWPRVEVDEAAIQDWSTMGRYLATGVRVQDRLCVLDFDINDRDALVEIWRRLPKKLRALLDSMPVRFGSGEKFAVFCRLAENARKRDLKSGSFARPGETNTHRLEVYCGEGPRQFGAFGPHSHTPEGEVAVEYGWGERSLLDIPLDDLPEITGPQLTALCKHVTETLDRLGWTHDAKAALEAHGAPGAHVFTITPEMTFDTQECGPVDLAGLESLCVGIGPDDQGIRLSASFIDPSGVNETRCQARLSPQDKRLLIHDHMTDRNHRPVELKPKPWTPASIEKFQRLIGKAAK